MSKQPQQENIIERPPIIVVMGHIDHGKSTLLDYIRKTNIVDTESGGITQHISAYEVIHKNQSGEDKKITFLDTPGHEAFSAMRARGAVLADIAILIVSAEDGVKAQTMEAYNEIKKAKTPFIVAINKIDKPNANPEKVKNELLEKEIYLEGYGGDIPYVEISSKTGQGISEILDMMLLVSEIEELKADTSVNAEGVIIEVNVDPKKGISATLIITSGSLQKGIYIATGSSISPVRMIENFIGKQIEEATFSSPIRITGFDSAPKIGSKFISYSTKKEAEVFAKKSKGLNEKKEIIGDENAEVIIPIILKTDVLGTLGAISKELNKVTNDSVALKIIHKGAGDVTENDINIAIGAVDAVIIGFRVGIDNKASGASEKFGIPIHTFGIIYNITDYVETLIKERTPKKEVEQITGKGKILKVFNKNRDKQVMGGKVLEGVITKGAKIKILRRETEVGTGQVLELQQQRVAVTEAKEDTEFGIMIESRTEIAEGDIIIPFVVITK